jgi:hypothetical protein
MKTDAPPTYETIEKLLEAARRVAQVQPAPKALGTDNCPVCDAPVVLRHGHAVCVSDTCRERMIEGCCGE